MKRLISSILCITMLLSATIIFASEIDSSEKARLRSQRSQEIHDNITYAYEQEDYNEQDYQKFNLKENAVMNGDSGTDLDRLEQVIKESKALLEEKELSFKSEIGDLERADNYDFDYKTCRVPVFEQINSYYCGPATVKQVLDYINGYSSSQSSYAGRLGTTTSGTDMTAIPPIINSDIGRNWYIYTTFRSFSQWFNCVQSSINSDYPAILDIDTRYVRAFPYNSSGHFVNVSGYDIYDDLNIHDVRITDPWGPGLGNRWYESYDVYNANSDHWRSAIIW